MGSPRALLGQETLRLRSWSFNVRALIFMALYIPKAASLNARLRTREFAGCGADAPGLAGALGALAPVVGEADVKEDPPDVTVEPAVVGAVPEIDTACGGSEPVCR